MPAAENRALATGCARCAVGHRSDCGSGCSAVRDAHGPHCGFCCDPSPCLSYDAAFRDYDCGCVQLHELGLMNRLVRHLEHRLQAPLRFTLYK